MSKRRIYVLDTTLRDGEQAPGFSMARYVKLELARHLERMKVDIIEAGFPAASEEDFLAVSEVAAAVRDCAVTGLCRGIHRDIRRTWEAVRLGTAPLINIFLPVSDIHLEYKLHISREELLEIVKNAVTLAKSLCPEVMFTAEDATRADRDFLKSVLRAAENAGAGIMNIADTVGYTVPEEMAFLVAVIKAGLDPATRLGIHCHNDLGMATANTLSAVMAGADQFDCTVAGIGERAGMAALEEVVMGLRVREDLYRADTRVISREFFKAGKLLANHVDLSLHPHKAVIGKNAFAHEAGVHQHGVMQSPITYEIMNPEDVGIHVNQMVMGKHSGKAALRERLEQLGYSLPENTLDEIFTRFKALTDTKRSVNDADIEKLVRGQVKRHQAYSLHSFTVNSGSNIAATAVVKLEHDGKLAENTAKGETPTIAVFNAVDKIVERSFPLHHFSIQSISEGRTELSETTVQVWNGDRLEVGRGLNTDIVQASVEAYISAINNAILRSNDDG